MANSPVFEWHPARYLQSSELADDFALLVLNQPLKNGVNLRKLWNHCESLNPGPGPCTRRV